MTVDEEGTETEVDEVTHWGCQFVRPNGSVYITRWDPGYGSGNYVPYTEEEARADVARADRDPGLRKGFTKRLVTRTETTTVVTTAWKEVE